MEFKKAERKKAWIKLAMTGPSGSGKTYSALLMAKGIGGSIGVIDTENESAQLYAGLPEMPAFEHLCIDPPYTIQKYAEAMKLATAAKFNVLIIDSITHAWAGEGGLLQQKEEIDARGGKGDKNKFANWATITKLHEQFKAWLLKIDMHLFVTMRSKQDYVLGEGNSPVKVGLAPIQREGMEYEFTTVLDMAMNHTAKASKDRTGLFGGQLFTPSAIHGEALMKWLSGGSGELARVGASPQPPVLTVTKSAPAPTSVATPNQNEAWQRVYQTVFTELKATGWGNEAIRAFIQAVHPGCEDIRKLNKLSLETLQLALKERLKQIKTVGLGSNEDMAMAAQETQTESLRQ